MGMSASALSTPLPRSAVRGFSSLRRSLVMALGRAAYGLFYAAVAAFLVGVPLGVGFLLWHWLTH